jgi:hypothetical protein
MKIHGSYAQQMRRDDTCALCDASDICWASTATVQYQQGFPPRPKASEHGLSRVGFVVDSGTKIGFLRVLRRVSGPSDGGLGSTPAKYFTDIYVRA